MSLTEFIVEQAALARLGPAGWQVDDGAKTAPGEPTAERDDYGQVVPVQRLLEALLQKLISGELRVEAANRAIKESTV